LHDVIAMKKESDIWASMTKNMDLIEGASVAKSFPLLLVLNGATEPLTTSEVSERIAKNSAGGLFIIPSTARSALEVLRSHELVEGKDEVNEGKGAKKKPIARTTYSITAKGRKLVKAWSGFLAGAED
jgi:hypothetical protein